MINVIHIPTNKFTIIIFNDKRRCRSAFVYIQFVPIRYLYDCTYIIYLYTYYFQIESIIMTVCGFIILSINAVLSKARYTREGVIRTARRGTYSHHLRCREINILLFNLMSLPRALGETYLRYNTFVWRRGGNNG